MEYFCYIVASLGAGIGTGLVGISAATVMVPILIVLCPSFSGEMGVYQATAIALISDILASAGTSYVYIKNKNIDVKRAKIMFICIIFMCILGSVVASFVGNIILGSFSLIATLIVGIRFLAKPDTSERNAKIKQKLNKSEIIISLICGTLIGFGTGFQGSGGGMMMLLVFTIFLKMSRKKAIGTSTLIMTFTALIASISHIIIEPNIVLEKWNVVIVCVIVTTLSSIIAAKFANKFSDKVVGIATGSILTILGIALIILKLFMI